MADEDGFAWKGAPRPRTSGGFVDGVGVNTPLSPLAISPDAAAPEHSRSGGAGSRSGVGGAGPNLDLERMEPDGDGDFSTTRRNGRVRLIP